MEVTAEVHFAQRLACNDSKLSEKALKKVGKWFAVKSVREDAFTEDSMLKLWKGLFYYYWNADKPLFQEARADVISSYIHVFKSVDYSFLYIDTFFQTMAREWLAIDRYRIEKFMMLVRRFLHETYQFLKKLKWKMKWIKLFRATVKKTVISSEGAPLGLKLHISDIYMEELAKVGADELTAEITQEFLVPYCRVLIECDELIYLESISKDVFLYLLNQTPDEDLFKEFPVLKFDATSVQNLLIKYANKPSVKKPNMKVIYDIVKEFEDFKNNVSSLDKVFNKVENIKVPKLKKRTIEKAALELFNEDIAYTEENRKSKKKKKKQGNVIDL